MTRCQHLVQRETVDNASGILLSSMPCQAEALPDGWCAWHRAGYDVMEAGWICGYQELQVNKHLIIMAGFYQWLAYAVVATPERVRQIKEAIFERMYSRK